jgi:predicted small integral membrane protein
MRYVSTIIAMLLSGITGAYAEDVDIIMSAKIHDEGKVITSGMVWRIFKTSSQNSAGYELLKTVRSARLFTSLPPGGYMLNAAYGLASITTPLNVLPGQALEQTLVLNAGGMKIITASAAGKPLIHQHVRNLLYSSEVNRFGERALLADNIKPGAITRLNAGIYYIVSKYGNVNDVIRTDITVEAGKLSELTITHSGVWTTFRLVVHSGSEALAGTTWDILSPKGELIKQSTGALISHILMPGKYTVLARREGKNYTRNFEVKAGRPQEIEVVME